MNDAKNERELREMREIVEQESLINKRVSVAGSFLDFALFVEHVEHLKFIIEAGSEDIKYYTLLLWLIIASLALQV